MQWIFIRHQFYRHLTFAVMYLVLWCTAANANAAPATPVTNLNHYFQESWTTRQGLPHNTINSISQSEDGYLWIATWEGLVRFNGKQFRVFGRTDLDGLPDSGIRSISLDRKGALLAVGSRGGFIRRQIKSWQAFPSLNVLTNAVVQDERLGYWLATEGQGLYYQHADGSRVQYTVNDGLPSNVIHSLARDSAGRIWIGTGRGLAVIEHEGSVIRVISDVPAIPVFTLLSQGEMLLVGTENGAYSWQQGQAHLFHPGLNGMAISALLWRNDTLWVGTTDRGLFRILRGQLEQLSIDGGSPNNRILSLFADRENSIWAGTNGGLFRLREAPFVTYTAERGLAGDYVRSVMAHRDGSIWVGTSQGISRIQNQQIETINIAADSQGQSVLSLAQAEDGAVWIGTYTDGVLLWRDGRIVQQLNRDNGLLANEIRSVLPDGKGGLWVGTAQGLNHVSMQGIKTYGTADGLPAPFIMALYQYTDGRLFIGTGGGVAVMQPDGRITPLDFSSLDGAEYAFGFLPDPVLDVLWMTTDRGLIAYELTQGRQTMLGREQGLPFDKLFQAVADKQHNLWISSNRGILRLQRQHVMALLSGAATTLEFEIFGESDGMQSAQANGGSMPAATLAHAGSVWFATSKGVSWVQPGILKHFAATIPPVVIEGVRINGAELQPSQNIQFPAGVSRLEFSFAGLGYVMPQRMLYRTRLVGFDSDWVYRSTQNVAEYTNLSPGNYEFRVSAAYPQGGWSPQDAVLRFRIKPFFWQLPAFWFVLFTITLVSVVILVRWRIGQLKRREQLLQLQIAEKTAELQQLARSDALTGLANRRAFDEALHRECVRARRSGSPLMLVLLDIDHFKQVNDKFSHSVGDTVLKHIANEISRHCREGDTVARWGGEEFAILLPDTSVTDAAEICERIRSAIMQIDCSAYADGLALTISMGIAAFSAETSHSKLLVRADQALYQAKQQGRNRIDIASF